MSNKDSSDAFGRAYFSAFVENELQFVCTGSA